MDQKAWRIWPWRVQGVISNMYAPRHGRVLAVIAVTRGQAADTSHSVSNGCCGGSQIEHAQSAGSRAFIQDPPLVQQHGNTGRQTAEPRKAGPKPAQEGHHDIERLVPPRNENLSHRFPQSGGVL